MATKPEQLILALADDINDGMSNGYPLQSMVSPPWLRFKCCIRIAFGRRRILLILMKLAEIQRLGVILSVG